MPADAPGGGICSQLGEIPSFSFQHLIYSSNHLNYSVVWALLDTLSRELQALVEHPNGTKSNPATTCKELLLAQPGLPDGSGGTGRVPLGLARSPELSRTRAGTGSSWK